MPTEPFALDLRDGRSDAERLGEVDRRLAGPDAPGILPVRADLTGWPRLVTTLCELRGRGIFPMIELAPAPLPADAVLLERLRFLADWDQCLLANVLVVVDGWLPDAHRTPLAGEARLERKCYLEWATAAVEPRLGRYPALPWRRFIRNVNEENFRFAEACVLGQNDAAALNAAVRGLLEAKRKTVNIFPKKWNARRAEETAP